MGSFAATNTTSTTNYSNLPITQEDVTNPINLLNATGNKLGSSELTLGAGAGFASNTTNNTNSLDGGAIGRAFDFGSQAVGIIADLTKSSNDALIKSNTQAVGLAATAQTALSANTTPESAADWTQNKTLIYAAVATAVAFFYFKRG